MEVFNSIIRQSQGYADPSIPINPRDRNAFKGISGAFENLDPLPFSSTVAFKKSNYRIVYQHTMAPWGNQSELQVSPGALLFGDRSMSKENPYVFADLTLASLNDQLRSGFERFQALKLTSSDEALDFENAVLNNPEMLRKMAMYEKLVVCGGHPVPPELGAAKKWYALATKFKYRAMTKIGILKQYNFLGVVLTRGLSSDVHDPRSWRQDTVSNVAIVWRGEAKVVNVWGSPKNLTPNAKLYLVLTRNKDGMYKVVPVATRRERPPLEGEHMWYVGCVKYNVTQAPAPEIVANAISHKDPVAAYEAVERIQHIDIDVRI